LGWALSACTYPALKFAGLMTDGDVSIGKIIRNETKIRHLLDIGHSAKSFIRDRVFRGWLRISKLGE
jgi:hypothetical protein